MKFFKIIFSVLKYYLFTKRTEAHNDDLLKENNEIIHENGKVTDIDGWEYDFCSLPKWNLRKKIPYVYDEMYEIKDKNVAFLIYSIVEASMCNYIGRLAIFKNKIKPELILNEYNVCFRNWAFVNSYGNLVFIETHLTDAYPIFIFDLKKEQFSFIALENGYSYKVEEISNSQFKIIDHQHQDGIVSRNGEIIDIEKYKWYPFSKFRLVESIYSQNKDK